MTDVSGVATQRSLPEIQSGITYSPPAALSSHYVIVLEIDEGAARS